MGHDDPAGVFENILGINIADFFVQDFPFEDTDLKIQTLIKMSEFAYAVGDEKGRMQEVQSAVFKILYDADRDLCIHMMERLIQDMQLGMFALMSMIIDSIDDHVAVSEEDRVAMIEGLPRSTREAMSAAFVTSKEKLAKLCDKAETEVLLKVIAEGEGGEYAPVGVLLKDEEMDDSE